MILIDLTHTFTDSMPVYPGDPVPSLQQIADISHDGYNEFKISTGMHVGTHMDAPLHMIDGGQYLSEVDVNRFAGKGHLIDARKTAVIDASLLQHMKIEQGDIVLVLTGFSEKFLSGEYYKDYPELSEDFAHALVKLGVGIVGMDTPSPDRSPFPIHKILLGNGTLILENLTNLESLIDHDAFSIIALPPKLQTDAAPARVVAVMDT